MHITSRIQGFNIDDVEGWKLVGPVSRLKGQLEFDKTIDVAVSIKEKGYRPSYIRDHIKAYILVWDGSCRLMLSGANHRMAALSALGFKQLPVIISSYSVAYRNQVDCWPGVRAGVFTNDEALTVFDRVFQAKQPSFCEDIWPGPYSFSLRL